MKKINRPQRYRLRRILELIRRGTRNAQLVSSQELSRELEVHHNTIRSDLACLRDDENAPIEYDAARHGYLLTDLTWEMPAFEISRGELFAFSVADKVIRAFRGTPLETDMRSVMAKVQASMEGKITIDPAALTDNITVLSEDYVLIDPEIWAGVARSLDRQEQIRARYTKFNGSEGDYVLDPYHLVAFHGDWYLEAYHHGRGCLASFAVSRIREVRATGKTYEIPDDFDPGARLKERFGITGGEKILRVRLKISPTIAAYIRQRVWHPTQEIVERRDGSIELRLETTGWKELVRWILSWQPDVKVLAPRKLRDRVEEKMRMALGETG